MTSINIEIELEGINQLLAQLKDLGEDADLVMLETITDLATDTHENALNGIAGPPKSGKVYEKYNPRRTHQASAPGQYPSSDTGQLLTNVRVAGLDLPTIARMEAKVGTSIMHGRYLEFGTPRMLARPWLLPSFERARQGVETELRRRLEARV